MIATSLAVANISAAQSSLRSTLQPLIDYFNDLRLVPIIVPRGQEIGDVFDASTLQFVFAARDCFPGIKPTIRPSTLPSFESASLEAGFLAVGVPAVANASVTEGIERSTQIGFTDLQVATISEADLKKAFNAAACPELDAAVNTRATTWFGRQLVIIGELYLGHRSLQLDLRQNVDVKAKIKDLATLFATGGIPVDISTSLRADGRSRVLIRETKVVPLAVRPAFIARPLALQSLGDGGTKPLQTVRWEAFDPDLPSQKELLSTLSKLVVEAETANAKH